MAIDINCDMGEAFSIYRCGDDEGIMPYITVANVACGFHASDPNVMAKTIKLAKANGVRVGAHPSYPDREGFGRRYMRMDADEIVNAIVYQVGALKGFLEAEGMTLNHIKPHGALYGAAWREEAVAAAIAEAARRFGVPVMGMSGTLPEKIYPSRGVDMIYEMYVDLEYNDAGEIIITREHKPVDPQEAVAQALRAVTEGKVKTISGNEVPVKVDTICVHSDTPTAVEVAKAVREAVAPYMN